MISRLIALLNRLYWHRENITRTGFALLRPSYNLDFNLVNSNLSQRFEILCLHQAVCIIHFNETWKITIVKLSQRALIHYGDVDRWIDYLDACAREVWSTTLGKERARSTLLRSIQRYSQEDETVSDTKCVIPEIVPLPFDQAQAGGYLKSGRTESIWVDSHSRGVCRSSCVRACKGR